MDNEFTGINFEQIYAQRAKFLETMNNVMMGIEENLYTFFSLLRRSWASLNAVRFAQETTILVNEYLKNIGRYVDRIDNDITDSILTYSKKFGKGGALSGSGRDFSKWSIQGDYILDATNHNGITGMNIRLVEDLLNNELPKITTNATRKMASLTKTISLFDEKSEQKKAFETKIQSIKTLIYELLETIEKQIRFCIETEKNNILLAKQQVIQNMNGSNTTNA